MKEYKRLGAASALSNNEHGYLTLQFVDHDGGPYNLQPMISENTVILPDASRPAYGLAITGDAAVLERVGKALLTVARKAKADTDESESDEA